MPDLSPDTDMPPGGNAPRHDILVIGGSTGAIKPLQQICADLPADLAAGVFVVVHVGARGRNMMADILNERSALPVSTAEDGEPIRRGHIYVAPADHHLLVGPDRVVLGHGARENMSRPAIDPLFRSAAVHHGSRVVGTILSGRLNDGSAGLAAIKTCGGLAVVQNPTDAEAADMPMGALQACDVDHRAPADGLGGLLAELARTPAGPRLPVPPEIELEASLALGRIADSRALRRIANPSTLPCPSCGGVLSELKSGAPLRFRCQVGHAYTAEVLDSQQSGGANEALVVALRMMDSRATLVERMAQDARANGRDMTAEVFEARAREYREHAEAIRELVLRDRG